MNIFGRQYRLSEFIKKIPAFISIFYRALQFKNFTLLWSSYIEQSNHKGKILQTRDGYKIHLSNNNLDSITVMVIFCRQEYGKVLPGSVVIDVGANIGIFSLYAARCGAEKIYAFEPNKASYEVLLSNIWENYLEEKIFPFNLAVGPIDGQLVSIPKDSSPMNRSMVKTEEDVNYDIIESISLHSIINDNKIENIDFLKMDCEGAEYNIIYSMIKEDFERIKTFRLESHFSHEKEKLIGVFDKQKFKKTHEKNLIIWFDRLDSNQDAK